MLLNHLDMREFLSKEIHCLARRATAVVPAVGRGNRDGTDNMPMVYKDFHLESQRRHKELMMQVTYNIVRDDERQVEQKRVRVKLDKLDMFKHLRKFYFHGDMRGARLSRFGVW